MNSGVSSPSFSMTTDMMLSPRGWGRGSTAMTLPETEAWTGAETGAGFSPIFWPIFTRSPFCTRGLQGAPMCWIMGITTWGGGAMTVTGMSGLFM